MATEQPLVVRFDWKCSRRKGAFRIATLCCPNCRTEFEVSGGGGGHRCPRCGARDADYARQFICVLCRKPVDPDDSGSVELAGIIMHRECLEEISD